MQLHEHQHGPLETRHAKPPLEGVEADLAMGPRELHLHPPHTPWGRGYSTCDAVHGLQVDVEGRRAVLSVGTAVRLRAGRAGLTCKRAIPTTNHHQTQQGTPIDYFECAHKV